jgi:hypothetical protein
VDVIFMGTLIACTSNSTLKLWVSELS